MIDLGRPPLHTGGVTLFRDHAEPRRLHFLPDAPRLRTADDGKPELRLLKYRLDPTLHQALGAGLLSLSVDLAVDGDRLQKLAELAATKLSLDGPAELVPVAPESGSCSVVVIDRGSDDNSAAGASGFGLVQKIYGAAQPSLYGDEVATFLAVLSGEGLSTVEGALRQGALPVGVVYGLQVLGLRPALRARITARWQEVYDFYENRLHGGKLLVAADLGTTTQQLVQDQLIHVELDELLPEDQRQATWDRAVDNAERYITETLFVPTLGSAPPPTDAHGDALETIGTAVKDLAGFFSFTYSLRSIDRSELKTATYALDVAAAERLTLAPQGALSRLADGVDVDSLITVVEPAAADTLRFDVGALVDLDAAGIDHLDVTVTYGAHASQLTLDGKTPRAPLELAFDAAVDPAIRYRYAIHFRPGGGTADVLESPEVTTADRVIRIDPRALYQEVALALVAAGVPWDRYPQVIVDLRGDDPADGWSLTNTLTLDGAHPEATWRLRATPGAEVRFQRKLRYVDAHGGETAVDWDFVPAGTLVVGDPFPALLDVAILAAADFTNEVRRIVVELRPKAHPDQVTTRILTVDQPFASWSVAFGGDEERAWEYRVTVETVRNEVNAGPWLAGLGARLVVGASFARLRAVQLLFLGRSLAALHLLGVKVRFAFDDAQADPPLHAESEQLVQDLSKPLSWSYPVADPERQAWSWQLTLIHDDGRTEVRDPVTTSGLLVVVPLT